MHLTDNFRYCTVVPLKFKVLLYHHGYLWIHHTGLHVLIYFLCSGINSLKDAFFRINILVCVPCLPVFMSLGQLD